MEKPELTNNGHLFQATFSFLGPEGGRYIQVLLYIKKVK